MNEEVPAAVRDILGIVAEVAEGLLTVARGEAKWPLSQSYLDEKASSIHALLRAARAELAADKQERQMAALDDLSRRIRVRPVGEPS